MRAPPRMHVTEPAGAPAEPRLRSASVPADAVVADPADIASRLAKDRDRIAAGVNDLVVHRMFSAALALESALCTMPDDRAAAKVRGALSELDLAVRCLRDVLFDATAGLTS